MDCMQLMGQALATVEPHTIWPEAKRQYEALVQAQSEDGNDATKWTTRYQFDLPRFYYKLFKEATKDLKDEWRIMLQCVCFAYKTKRRVTEFLDLLDPKMFEWAEPLLQFVRENGRNSNFDEPIATAPAAALNAENEKVPLVKEAERSLPSPPPSQDTVPAQESSAAKITPAQTQKPYFIIPTLPLAVPADFFSALALQGPLESLNVEQLLIYPSALQIALTDEMKEDLFADIPDFWKPKKAMRHGTAYKNEKREWRALFRHLLQGESRLVTPNDGKLEHDADGYNVVDLSLWLAGWMAHRVAATTSVQGCDLRKKLRASGGSQPRRNKRSNAARAKEKDTSLVQFAEYEEESSSSDEEPELVKAPKISDVAGPSSPEAKERKKAWNERKAQLINRGVSNHALVDEMLKWTRQQERTRKKKVTKRVPGF